MRNTDCEINTDQLIAYLEAPTQYPEVEAHLETCPSCQQKLARLSQAVLSQHPDNLTCSECQARLPDYVQAQVEGEDPTRLFPDVRDHLLLCPHCQRLHQELSEIDDLILSGDLPKPAVYHPPDLSFLQRLQPPAGLGEILRRGAYWAQVRKRALFVDMGAFTSAALSTSFQALGRQPTLASETRRDAYKAEDILYQFTLGQEDLDDLVVEVTVHRQLEQPQVAKVVIQVRVPSLFLVGFSGSQVQMKSGETTRTARTGDDGLAVFENVPLAELKEAIFTIIPP